MTRQRILIVEDDREIRISLVELLEAAGWSAVAVSRSTEALKRLPEIQPSVVLSDVRMPGMSGLDLLDRFTDEEPPIVLISAHGDIPMAVDAMSRGAYSFIEKPYEPRRLLTILSHAADQFEMRERNRRLQDRLRALSGLDRILLGDSEIMKDLRASLVDLADSPAPVMIQGETGTGKELVARALHDLSPQSGHGFFAINTAQLTPENLFASVTLADGGTLFLDEIVACSAEVQAMLLRILERGEVLEPQTGKTLPLSLRILSATNVEIDDAINTGRLRDDLLYRLNTLTVALPPLRDRLDDVPLLARHFLGLMAVTYEVAPPDLSAEDLQILLSYDWPGNVRELRSAVERRVLMARRGQGSFGIALRAQDVIDHVPDTLREAVAALEKELIGNAIQSHQGRMDAVAEALGIGRRTLNEKIVKLGLDKDALL